MGYDDETEAFETKACRYCGEDIRKAAVKCRHCGEHLNRRPGGGDAATRKQIDDAATLSLIMGIVGIVVCPFTLPIAVIKGNEAKRRAVAARVPVPGAATAGIFMGWGFGILNVLVYGLVFVMIIVAVVSGVR